MLHFLIFLAHGRLLPYPTKALKSVFGEDATLGPREPNEVNYCPGVHHQAQEKRPEKKRRDPFVGP